MNKAVKVVLGGLGGLFLVALVLFSMEWAASESAEVVVLTSLDASGQPQETRLWVVDHEGLQYLRVGGDGSGWYARLVARPEVSLERDGRVAEYVAEPRPGLSAPINALMQEKYGWRDSYIALLVGGREGSIPIALMPRG